MIRRRDFHFVAAVVGSVAVHLAFLTLGRRVEVGPSRLPSAPRTLAINLNNLHVDPELEAAAKSIVKPPAPDEFHEDIGDALGTGSGANAAAGDTPMKAPEADQEQALLGKSPPGAGKVGDAPSKLTGPQGDGGHGGSPGLVAPPPAPPAQPPAVRESADSASNVAPAPAPLVRSNERHDAPVATIPPTAPPAPLLTDVKAPAAKAPGESPVAPAPPTEALKVPRDETPRHLQYAMLDPSAVPPAARSSSPEQQSDSKLVPATKLKVEPADKLSAPKVPPSADPSVQVAMAPPAPDVPSVTDSSATEPPTPNSDLALRAPAAEESPQRSAKAPASPQAVRQQPPAVSQSLTGDGVAPGQHAAPSDPAPQSDSESDPFAKIGSAVYHNGRLDIRRGRKVKTTRPRILVSGLVDTLGLADPTVVLRVSIDPTGHVTSADIIRSSGSNDLDQPTRVAMYDWWFEPAKNSAGQPIPDVFPFSITFR